jgi:hypothetical protein
MEREDEEGELVSLLCSRSPDGQRSLGRTDRPPGAAHRCISLRNIPLLSSALRASLSRDARQDNPLNVRDSAYGGRGYGLCPAIGPRNKPRHVHFVNHLRDIPGPAAHLNKAGATTSPHYLSYLSYAVWQRAGHPSPDAH